MMNPKKGICKFKGDCKNYKMGQTCPWSHETCKFGTNCNRGDKCPYFHDNSNNSNNPNPSAKPGFNKPMR